MQNCSIKLKIKKTDARKLVLSDKKDLQILQIIYVLERKKLSVADRKLIKFIKTQLEKDWRKPLLEFAQDLLKKYK